MPARPGKVPAYCHHKASGRSVVRIHGRDHYLGPYGSPESHERYARLIAELRRPRAIPDRASRNEKSSIRSINEIMLTYFEFARGYDTKDGKPNQEFESIRYALRPLKEFYGHKPSASFGPRDLKTLRQQLIDRGLSRTYINYNTKANQQVREIAAHDQSLKV